jgi:hypothetical protein
MAADWPGSIPYEVVSPRAENRFSLRPTDISDEYLSWAPVDEIARVDSQLGLNENRGGGLQNSDRDALLKGIEAFIQGQDDGARGLGRAAAGYDPEGMRKVLQGLPPETRGHAVPYLMRPFDQGWAFVSDVRGLWNRPRPTLQGWMQGSAGFLLTRPAAAVRDEGFPATFSRTLGEQDLLRGHAYFIPLEIPVAATEEKPPTSSPEAEGGPNLSVKAHEWLRDIGWQSAYSDVWFHSLSVLYSRKYLVENAAGIAGGWPRVPLPRSAEALASSIELGRRTARLLDASQPSEPGSLSGVSFIGAVSSTTGQLDPATDLAVTARWGIAGKGGICMPSTGKLTERDYTVDEHGAIMQHAQALDMPTESVIELLGETCFDVWLNDVAYWRCVPSAVWRYKIGGNQVVKKWLSYRQRALLGRDLTSDELRGVADMVRRIAALVLMGPEHDSNYERVKTDVWGWNRS